MNEFVENCSDGCPGCACHIAPPCSHCIEHLVPAEPEEEPQLTEADVKTAMADIVESEDGKVIHAVMSLRGETVKERIPRQVLKWDDEKQSAYLDEVIARQRKELTKKLVKAGKAISSTAFERQRAKQKQRAPKVKRLMDARHSQELIKQRRVEAMLKKRNVKLGTIIDVELVGEGDQAPGLLPAKESA